MADALKRFYRTAKSKVTPNNRAPNFIYSSEFRDKNPSLHVSLLSGDEPAMTFEEVSTEHDLQKLFDHIQSNWEELGKREPHWSVVVAEQYQQANIQAHEKEFYQTSTGLQDLQNE